MERREAIELLKKYNEEEFHIRHALTVEGVMIYFAEQMGFHLSTQRLEKEPDVRLYVYDL